MPKASVKRLIDNRKDKIIDFVLDIEKYPEFIPFCESSKIYERSDDGDTVNIVIDPSYHRGQPHHRFHGLTGKVMKIQGKAYVIRTSVGNMDKDLIVRPEHLRKAK